LASALIDLGSLTGDDKDDLKGEKGLII